MRRLRNIVLFPNLNLREKILITLLPIWAVFLTVLAVVYSVMMQALEKELIHNSYQTLLMVSSDITTSLDRMENSVGSFIRSTNMQKYLYSETSSNSKASVRGMFTRLFNYEIITTVPYAKSAYLIKNEDDYLYIEPSASMSEQDISQFVSSVFRENYGNYSAKYQLPTQQPFREAGLLHYVLPVPNLELVTRQKSLLVVNISQTFVSNIYSKYSAVNLPDSVFSVYDDSGNLICRSPAGPDYGVSFSQPPETGYVVQPSGDGDILVMSARIDDIQWVATIAVPLENVLAPTKPYQTAFLLLAAGGMLVSLLLLYLSTASSFARLREMSAVMEEVKNGRLSSRFPVKYHDEISVMGSEFNHMIDNLQHLRLDIAELNLRQREAELHALQSQINPHFLYNTLESIRMMAMEQGCDEVSEQIKTLSDMFRYTISADGAGQVYVWQELEHVYAYLTIQSFRFIDRYDVQIYVDDDILKLRTLKLILQPLVENAFTHGVRSMKRGGRIVLTGRREGDVVCFTVRDNGVGMSEQALAALRTELMATPYEPRQGKSIGIANVNDRLKLTYGELFALKIDSAPGQGTTVTLTFPAIEEEVRPVC